MGGSRKFRQGGPYNICFLVINRTDLSRETIRPLLLKGGPYQNS